MNKNALFFCFFLVFSGLLFAQTEKDFNVTLNKSGDGVVITGYTGKAVNVRIPAVIQGMPVKEIGEEAFHLSSSPISVVIPVGVTIIGDDAFSWCSSLTSVTIPEGVTTIGNSAFSSTKISSITLPKSLTRLGNGVFYNCEYLSSVVIRTASLVSIPRSSFNVCYSLSKFVFPEGITTIEDNAFSGCSFTSLVIPEGITSIGKGAFENCISLTSLTLPSSIKNIGDDAFSSCSSLITVTIPNSVELVTFGYDVFSFCGKINLASQGSLKKRGYNSGFSNKTQYGF